MIDMVALLEITVFALAILAAVILYKILKTIKRMAINTVIGLVLLVLANAVFDIKIAYSWVVIAICALAGTVGALLVIILHALGVAF